MQKIQGQAKTIRELLGVKYGIDFYQREYKWETKQIQELLDDLTGKFLDDYRPGHPRSSVAGYGRYFLGSIIISQKGNVGYIVDGQQRLTSLTLLLIYLRNLQRDRPGGTSIDALIFSEQYGEKSSNLAVAERTPAMEALYENQPFDETDEPESVQNIIRRYRDIDDHFPEDLRAAALHHFTDWLIDNVHLVEITAFSDDDAYTIFETMNDRGLSLSPTDMLKGYLLANVDDENKRFIANELWKERTLELREVGKEVEADCFKAWLRSQYAAKIRAREKGAKAEDFDRIGTEFHRWVREHADEKDDDGLVLKTSDDFFNFIHRDFDFFSKQYLKLMAASAALTPGLEHVLYNAKLGFTLQYMLALAPLNPTDDAQTVQLKERLVTMYINILLARRIWHFRSIVYSTMQYAIFLLMREIRGLQPEALASRLYKSLESEQSTFENPALRMHQQNRHQLHHILARMTDWIEQGLDNPSHYLDYVIDTGKNRYEVEHIWADKPERHRDEFDHPADFAEFRNRMGGLLLLPKSFNASYGAMPYDNKLKHYNTQHNMLARSLHPDAYDHNPKFTAFISKTGLPFRPHQQFKRVDLEERHRLYQLIAGQIWNPDLLLREVGL